MASIRLLQRLRALQRGQNRDSFDDPQEVVKSVVDHVNKLLNTRQGSSVLDQEFGIPDFTAIGVTYSREDIPRFEREIGQFIGRYEPRLKDLKVHYSPDPGDPFSINFIIDAGLPLQGGAVLPVTLMTHVDSSGQVKVSR